MAKSAKQCFNYLNNSKKYITTLNISAPIFQYLLFLLLNLCPRTTMNNREFAVDFVELKST